MTKTTLFFLAVFLFINTLNAQITKGNWLVGGNGSYTSLKDYNNSNSIISKTKAVLISSNLGYFVADKFATGIRLRYSYQKNAYTGLPASNSYYEFGFGPFVRYYFLNKEKPVNLFSEISYQYTIAKSNNNNSQNNRNTFSFLAGPVFFVNDIVGFELTIGYATTKNNKSDIKLNAFQVGAGIQIHLEKK